MTTLPSQEILKSLLDYNPSTGALLWKKRDPSLFPSKRLANAWNTRYEGSEAFTAIDRKGYRVGAIFNVPFRASRVIFKWYYGEDPVQVDHLDGNRENNRIENLRSVSPETNSRNLKLFSTNTSGHAGITWDVNRGKWSVRISDKGKTVNLGRFTDLNEAIKVRKKAEIDYKYHPSHGKR